MVCGDDGDGGVIEKTLMSVAAAPCVMQALKHAIRTKLQALPTVTSIHLVCITDEAAKGSAPAPGHPPILLAFPHAIIYPSGVTGRSLGGVGPIGEVIIFIAVFSLRALLAAGVANMAHIDGRFGSAALPREGSDRACRLPMTKTPPAEADGASV